MQRNLSTGLLSEIYWQLYFSSVNWCSIRLSQRLTLLSPMLTPHQHTQHTHTHAHSHCCAPITHTIRQTHTLHFSTPSTAVQHLNLRAIPSRLLNTTDWDEWQTSSASISSLILLVGQLLHIWYPPSYCCCWPQGTRNGFKAQIWRPGGSACWDTYHNAVGLSSVCGSWCTYYCHSGFPVTDECKLCDEQQIP